MIINYMENTAMVLISCDIGKEKKTQQLIQKISNVRDVHRVKGAYDLLVKVTAPNIDELRNIITWKIRKISSVHSTLTLRKQN